MLGLKLERRIQEEKTNLSITFKIIKTSYNL